MYTIHRSSLSALIITEEFPALHHSAPCTQPDCRARGGDACDHHVVSRRNSPLFHPHVRNLRSRSEGVFFIDFWLSLHQNPLDILKPSRLRWLMCSVELSAAASRSVEQLRQTPAPAAALGSCLCSTHLPDTDVFLTLHHNYALCCRNPMFFFPRILWSVKFTRTELVREVKDYTKGFNKYIDDERKFKENVGPAEGEGGAVEAGHEVLHALSASVFTERLACRNPREQGEMLERCTLGGKGSGHGVPKQTGCT
ncbi:uncharacterized protein LOC128851278 [Cuculus canorus]|uniref:uncharacterized protein LOC128851278 n=1 Tax=Cuculus canorus TaxID=55661 RepID=UPI0023AAD17F|nr:uncharacterized protein LOC128851278 [Cuculus canorus]